MKHKSKSSKRRDEIQRDWNDHIALLSPLRRLFPEILQLIFHYCLPSEHDAVMAVSEAPLLLGRVSKQLEGCGIHYTQPVVNHPYSSSSQGAH